jgi:hypothetical protein
MGVSLYGLDYFKTYEKLMKSPDVRHELFKVGLAATVGKEPFETLRQRYCFSSGFGFGTPLWTLLLPFRRFSRASFLSFFCY